MKILHNAQELANLIHEIGFIPLFSNVINGFSVEELTPGYNWWTGDLDTDPWEWRKILAADPDIAYGKFFNKNAGFVSKEFFPVFANYRRNGYDYDALYEDGLASFRSKKIMGVFELDDDACGLKLMTPEIKSRAGFGKDSGEKTIDGLLTDLQMQTYLIISEFRRKTNRMGQEYGWGIAVMETPETKWGYAHISSGYEEDPAESWKRIVSKLKEYCYDATDADIRKIMGIRYPGESVVRASAKPKEPPKPKRMRPQQLPWPENLMTEIGLETVFGSDTYIPLNDDQMKGLEFALDSLKEKEKTALLLRYKEHKTFKEVGELFSRSNERMRQIIARGIRKLRHPDRLKYYRDGYQGAIIMREEKLRRIRADISEKGVMETLNGIEIKESELSVRAYNCLHRAGIDTLGQVVEKMDQDPWNLLRVRNLGKKSLYEIIDKLEGFGVDCDPLREQAKKFYGENNPVPNTLRRK